MSEEISRRVDRSSVRLSKAEANAEAKLNRAMATKFNRLQRAVRSNWNEYRNLDRLPRKRAIALSKVLDEFLDVSPSNSEATFRELYRRSQAEGVSLARDLMRQIGIKDVRDAQRERATLYDDWDSFAFRTNDFVDFWTSDSAGRLGDWGQKFKRDATAIFELGMSQGWRPNRVNDALSARFGQLLQQTERIVRTGSVSTRNSVASEFYKQNGITLVQWQISRTAADRTCNYCSPRNGNIYYIDRITYPLHPRERCTLLPVTRRKLLYNSDRDYWKEQKTLGLEALKEAGGKPNYGLAPFEKRTGREKPPKPIWQPDKGYSYGEKSKTRRLVDE